MQGETEYRVIRVKVSDSDAMHADVYVCSSLENCFIPAETGDLLIIKTQECVRRFIMVDKTFTHKHPIGNGWKKVENGE